MSEIESSLVKWNLALALCWPSKENSRSSAKVFHCKLRSQDGKSRCGLSSSKVKSLFYFDKDYFVCLHWVLTVWCLASQVFVATKSKLYVKSLFSFDTVINKTDIFLQRNGFIFVILAAFCVDLSTQEGNDTFSVNSRDGKGTNTNKTILETKKTLLILRPRNTAAVE